MRTTAYVGVMRDFLNWLGGQARTYDETMDAWRSSCPRQSVWEDALDDGLIELRVLAGSRRAIVTLTDRGRAALGT
ncbi:MAG: hypothetical protein U0821_16060 [Chloroflexota bacterium]